MKKPIIYLIIGVPGVGKSWVCEQLDGKHCAYVKHDLYIKDDAGYIDGLKVAAQAEQPVITDCPFAERITKEKLEAAGFEVRPWFIVESPIVVMARYRQRTGKNLPQASITRAGSILDRAKAWNAPYGTSQEVKDKLEAALVTEQYHGSGRAYL